MTNHIDHHATIQAAADAYPHEPFYVPTSAVRVWREIGDRSPSLANAGWLELLYVDSHDQPRRALTTVDWLAQSLGCFAGYEHNRPTADAFEHRPFHPERAAAPDHPVRRPRKVNRRGRSWAFAANQADAYAAYPIPPRVASAAPEAIPAPSPAPAAGAEVEVAPVAAPEVIEAPAPRKRKAPSAKPYDDLRGYTAWRIGLVEDRQHKLTQKPVVQPVELPQPAPVVDDIEAPTPSGINSAKLDEVLWKVRALHAIVASLGLAKLPGAVAAM